MNKEQKELLREYLITTSCFDEFNEDYTINDWCIEFCSTQDKFHEMHNLATKYLRKKFIIKTN